MLLDIDNSGWRRVESRLALGGEDGSSVDVHEAARLPSAMANLKESTHQLYDGIGTAGRFVSSSSVVAALSHGLFRCRSIAASRPIPLLS